MGGDSAETLLPVNLHSNEGGRGEQRWEPPTCTKLQLFLFLTLNSTSVVVVLGKVALGRRKNIMYFICSQP